MRRPWTHAATLQEGHSGLALHHDDDLTGELELIVVFSGLRQVSQAAPESSTCVDDVMRQPFMSSRAARCLDEDLGLVDDSSTDEQVRRTSAKDRRIKIGSWRRALSART